MLEDVAPPSRDSDGVQVEEAQVSLRIPTAFRTASGTESSTASCIQSVEPHTAGVFVTGNMRAEDRSFNNVDDDLELVQTHPPRMYSRRLCELPRTFHIRPIRLTFQHSLHMPRTSCLLSSLVTPQVEETSCFVHQGHWSKSRRCFYCWWLRT